MNEMCENKLVKGREGKKTRNKKEKENGKKYIENHKQLPDTLLFTQYLFLFVSFCVVVIMSCIESKLQKAQPIKTELIVAPANEYLASGGPKNGEPIRGEHSRTLLMNGCFYEDEFSESSF